MNLLQCRKKHGINHLSGITCAFVLTLLFSSFAYGSADLVVGVNETSVAPTDNARYFITDVVSGSSEITVFASEQYLGDSDLILAFIGEKGSSVLVDGKSYQSLQNNNDMALTETVDAPYYLWNLGPINKANFEYVFEFNGRKYYAQTLSIEGFKGEVLAKAFIDNDNDNYFSSGDVVSGYFNQDDNSLSLLDNAFPKMRIGENGQPIFSKAYNGDQEINEDVITSTSPYLEVDGIEIDPVADYHNDVLISLCDSEQNWTLLKEYTNWASVNIFGYYTDPGIGTDQTTVFWGPDAEGQTFTTNIPGGDSIGLWLLNDTNNDSVYNGTDSYLFSERYLTRNSFANEHQWFMVYDVKNYKGTSSNYTFYSSTGNYTTTGDYDYLIYIDDDHTSANWDHNDMIVGILCNNPPVAECPGDTTLFVCDLGEICLPGFSCSDPDDNLESCEISQGTLDGNSVCFTPTGEGTYTFALTATDTFGETDICQTNITVELNTPPTAVCPGDQTIFVCDDTDDICIPGFGYIDPDDNVVDVQVIGCELHQDTVCFTPEGSSKTITYIVTDACGASDTCYTNLTLNFNHAPVVSCPGDTSIFVCEYSEVCIPGFTYYDQDNNIANVEIIGCEIHEDTVCFTPEGPTKTITLIVTDECGLADTCYTNIDITLNSPPVAHGPFDGSKPGVSADTTIFLCELEEICLDGFYCTDPDDNLASCVAEGGTLSGSEICFTPVEGINQLMLVATDDCGEADTSYATVEVVLNTSPTVECPGDTTIFLCGTGSDICISGFSSNDDDDNIVSETVNTGTLANGTVCFTPVEGVNTIIYTVVDACGDTAQCQTNVTVEINIPPVASCPGDTTIFLCETSGEICLSGFIASDDNDNITHTGVDLGTLNGTEVCFTPVEGVNTITFTVIDGCDDTAQCFTNVTVELNSPPVVSCPGDTAMFLCSSGEVCLDGFSYSDANNNITDITVTGGTLNGTEVCFTPVEGVNTITLTVTDACGEVDECVTNVTVDFNEPPVVSCPGNDEISVCDLSELCIDGFSYSDADDNITDVIVTGGTLNGTEVCFTPVEGVNTITLTVTDACGEIDECTTNITVNLNSPPVVSCPGDDEISVCDLSELCIDGFTYSDADDNITDVTVTGGALNGTEVCFTPVEGVNTITLTVTDACGEVDQCTANITVNLNSPPVANCPSGYETMVCDLSEICIDGFTFTDPDDNITNIEIDGGTLNGTEVCFTPVEGVNTITATVTDACGETDQCTTTITVTLNSAPVVECPGDDEMTVCDLSEICIDGFRYSDIDDNITDVTVTGGTLNGTEVCFTPVEGVNTITLTVTDACGEVDQCQTDVTITLNSPPVANCPESLDLLVCDLSEVCVDGFTATDADDNITDITVTGGTLNGTEVCFTPVEGINTITMVVTDACDEADQCYTEINVTLNSAPSVSCPNDTVIQVGELTELCIDGFMYSDPDGNIQSASTDIGTLIGTEVCFTPVEGVNTITLTVIDECGLTDQCQTDITIVLNTCPELVRPLADTTALCVYEDFCDTIEVIDADGDMIEMTVNYGELTPIIDEPGHWLGLYCFYTEDYDCGEHNQYDIVIECDDGLCIDDVIIVYEVTVLGYIDIYMDQNVYVMPGMTGLVGVYIDTYDCLCVGGLSSSISWDPSVLNLVDIYPTENLDFGQEYYNINIGAFGSGTVKLSYIADLNDQVYHGPLCEIDPTEPIFYLELQLLPGEYPTDFIIPICFTNEDEILDNAISDSTGYHVWWGEGCNDQPDSSQYGTWLLNMECGSIWVLNECDLVLGDLNLNRRPYEVGDVVLLSNHLTNPDAYPFTDAQMAASDVNEDNIQASIADLIMMLNIINGNETLGKIAPPSTPTDLIVAHQSDGSAVIKVEASYDLGGLLLEIPIPNLANRSIEYNSELGMNVEITELDDKVRVLVYSESGNTIPAGTNDILRLNDATGFNLMPTEISVASVQGALANTIVSYEMPLPEQFGIANCYPNPFNPITNIQLTLPDDDYVTLAIYDIMGRKVAELINGYLEAGYHQVIWKGTNSSGEKVSSGIYFAKLLSKDNYANASIEKLVLLK